MKTSNLAVAIGLVAALASPAIAQDSDERGTGLDGEKLAELIEGEAGTKPAGPDAGTRKGGEKVRAVLESRKVSLHFSDTPFADAVAFLQDVTDVNVVLSKGVDEWIEAEAPTVTLKLKAIGLKNALALMLMGTSEELRFECREDHLWIGLASEVKSKRTLRLIPVDDITTPRPDHPAPRTGLPRPK